MYLPNTPPHFHVAKPNGHGEGPKAKEQKREMERTPFHGKDQKNTKGTRCNSTKNRTRAKNKNKNGRLEKVKLDQETRLPIQQDSLTIVQLVGQKAEPSILD